MQRHVNVVFESPIHIVLSRHRSEMHDLEAEPKKTWFTKERPRPRDEREVVQRGEVIHPLHPMILEDGHVTSCSIPVNNLYRTIVSVVVLHHSLTLKFRER